MSAVVQSIELRNFGSYRDATLTLGGAGVTAVAGHNGAGKSTITCKAITWCLFDKCSPERMGASTKALKGNDIIHRDADFASVTTTFEIDGKVYAVTRARKRGRRSELQISCDNVSLGGGQEALEKIIGVSYDVFTRTVVRGQGDPWNFAEATPTRKREILEVISGADILEEPYQRSRELEAAAKHKVTELEARLRDAKARLTTNDLDMLRQKIEDWEANYVAQAEAAAKEVDFYQAQADAAEANQELYELNRKERSDIKFPSLDLAPYDQAIQHYTAEEAKAWSKVTQLRRQAEEAKALISRGSCPTCGQGTASSQHLNAVAAPMTLTTDTQTAEELAREKANAEKAKQDALVWLEREKAQVRALLDALPEIKPVDVQSANDAVIKAQLRYDQVKNATNPFRELLAEAERRHTILQRDIVVLEEALNLEKHRQTLAYEWTTILHPKAVRTSMADGALLAIENAANRWLAALSDGRITISFSDDQNMNTIAKIDGHEQPLLAFSGGEKRRINMAVDLAVATVFSQGSSLALSLLVLDEENLSGLDEAGKSAVAKALNSAGVADVILIDHDPRLRDSFERIVTVVRDSEGYSQLVD